MSPDAPVHFQIVKGQQIGHVRILVGGHVEVTVLEGESDYRIPPAQQQRRKVVRRNLRIVLSHHLDKLVNQPNHRALILGPEQVTAARKAGEAEISPKIIGHMDGHLYSVTA